MQFEFANEADVTDLMFVFDASSYLTVEQVDRITLFDSTGSVRKFCYGAERSTIPTIFQVSCRGTDIKMIEMRVKRSDTSIKTLQLCNIAVFDSSCPDKVTTIEIPSSHVDSPFLFDLLSESFLLDITVPVAVIDPPNCFYVIDWRMYNENLLVDFISIKHVLNVREMQSKVIISHDV